MEFKREHEKGTKNVLKWWIDDKEVTFEQYETKVYEALFINNQIPDFSNNKRKDQETGNIIFTYNVT